MTLLRLLNVQGIAGLAAALCLGLLRLIQKGETRHWKKQSGQYEQLYRGEQAAFAGTVANVRAAAEQARAADRANAERVRADQARINERTSHDFQARLADARSRYAAAPGQLRGEAARGPANPGGGPAAAMPRLSVAAGGAAQSPGQDGFPKSERLIATEQAIQLDELIKWIRKQAAVSPNMDAATNQP
jgi:hypothetical protein